MTDIEERYGKESALDKVFNFYVGKLAPFGGFVADSIRGKNIVGEKFDVWKQVYSRMTPISVQNALEGTIQGRERSSAEMAGILLDVFGINTNTNSPRKTDWNESESKEIDEFKKSVAPGEFINANNDFDELSQKYVDNLMKTDSYKNADDKYKQSLILKAKSQAKTEVFEKYGYYKNVTQDWNLSESKELRQFRDAKGEEDFMKANDEYNALMKKKVDELNNDERYKKLSRDDKQKVLTNQKDSIKKEILRKYKFRYIQSKSVKDNTVEELSK